MRLIIFRLLFLLALGVALQAQSPQLPPRFALEIQTGEGAKPIYTVVPRGVENRQLTTVSFVHTLQPLPENSPEVAGSEQPTALGLEYKEEGDIVSVVASLYFGVSTARIDDLSKHPHRQIGSFPLHLEESVVLGEMKSFGVQPVILKLVSARAPSSNIQVVSKVPALQVAVAGEDRVLYKVEIHNLSSQSVIGLVIETSSTNGRSGITSYDDLKPLIAPGGFCRLPMNKNDLECPAPENPTLDPVPCPIVLEGALFADGTHSGDPVTVASMEAHGLATSSPRHQLRQLMQAIAHDPALSDDEKLARLHSEIPKLLEVSNASVVDRLRPRYPELSDEDWTRIINSLTDGIQREREMILHSIAKYEESSRSGANAESLTEWMRRWGLVD
jgi:hypothetical protein